MMTTMKKTFAYLLAVVAMAAVSCNKEMQETQVPEVELFPMTFTATTTETKTVLDQDHVSIDWLASDKISVFDGVGNQMFSTSGTGTTVQFSGNAATTGTYYALYPYNANAVLNGTTTATTVPEFQTAVKGSFIDGLNINASQSSDNNNFVFNNVLSVAKITIDGTKLGGKTLKAIKLSSTNYALTGDVIVSFGATCSAAAGTNTNNDVVLLGGANGIADGDYYFVLLPNQGGEIKLTFYSTDNYAASKTATLTKPFSAGTIKNLGTAQGLTWNAAGWKLVTNASSLQAGDELVIASNTQGKVASALSEDYLTEVSATFSQDKSIITSLPGTAMQFTLGGNSSAWTLTSSAGQLYANAVKKLNFSSNGTGTWTISISSNDATIQSSNSSYGRFLHNVNSPRFTTYTSNPTASMLLPQLYRKENDDPLVIPTSTVSAPTFSPVTGGYANAQTITITSATANATIFYTTGNSDFSEGDWTSYAGPFSVAASCTIKAVAIKNGFISAVSSETYNIGTQDHTATITFGNNGTKINSASVTGSDSQNNTWTITTTGTTSFTQHSDCSQVGSKDSPATNITFTTTLSSSALIKNMSAKFGGYGSTAGTVNLKVGTTTIGTGSLNGTNDVTVSSTTTATGTVLTVTVTNIARGLKVYNISVTYNN